MWWAFLLQYRKQGLMAGAVAAVFGAGYWYGVDSVEVTVASNKETIEKVIENNDIAENTKKDTKKTTIIEESPDGTKRTEIIEESTATTEVDTKVAKTTDRHNKEKPEVFQPHLPSRYKLGAFVAATPDDIKKGEKGEYQYGFSASLRLFGPVWLDGSYKFESENRSSEILLGGSWEF